ncbi:hypothetical protein J421_5329 (plasmid) [Gemmatirosa kalamazoonensis]|uniref:Transmembrane protein n=1 Tax=Gemmatirosa kalamazoonensis TaxID=861299 RepID=W0RPD1_9BACT|nr:hypothetical protein [Gemmatirosa kalamazoonensis]AHG92864.1 hypothetical protein J421_5329 [Gemmatirosa kalamazoonensis]
MPRVPYHRITLLLGLAYVASAGFVVRLGLNPRTYFFSTPEQRATWTVPWLALAFVCLLMLGEALVVLTALDPRPEGPLWRRGALGATAFAVWTVPSTFLGFLHAPAYLTWHALWVWALLAVLVLSTGVSLATAGVRRLSARRDQDGRADA